MIRFARIILALVVLIAIGIVATVGVAWLSVWRADFGAARNYVVPREWERPTPERWPDPTAAFRRTGPCWVLDVCAAGMSFDGAQMSWSMLVGRAGWPALALRWEQWHEAWSEGTGPAQQTTVVTDGHPEGLLALGLEYPGSAEAAIPGTGPWKRLPLMPVWPEFPLSVTFYSVLAGALWFVPRWIGRAVRSWRGK